VPTTKVQLLVNKLEPRHLWMIPKWLILFISLLGAFYYLFIVIFVLYYFNYDQKKKKKIR